MRPAVLGQTCLAASSVGERVTRHACKRHVTGHFRRSANAVSSFSHPWVSAAGDFAGGMPGAALGGRMTFTGAVPFLRVRVGPLLRGMYTPKDKSAPGESRQRTDPLLVQRLRVLLWLALSSWVLFAARDLWCDSVPTIEPHLIRLAFGAVFVGAAGAPITPEHAVDGVR